MNKVFKIIFICLLIAGSAVAAISDVPLVEYTGLAVAFLSAALACISIYKKSEKKDWKVIVSIVLIAIGAFALEFVGIGEDAITRIIAAVGGVVLLIFGLITSFATEKKN